MVGCANFWLPIIFLSISLLPFLHVKGDANLIEKTCRATKFNDLCVSSLKSDPISANADTRELAIIMAGIGLANATSTSSYLSSQLVKTSNDTVLRKVLEECAEKYSYANYAIEASVQALGAEDYDKARMHMIAAADYPNACHNAFKRYKGLAYPSEVGQREEILKHICVILLDIYDLLG